MTEYSVESSAEVVVDLNEKKPKRVLHVDDELGLLKVAKQCLEMQGPFQVDTAFCVEEAMEKMKKETYDAIVCDYQMPGKDGLEFLKDLRANGNSVPFVMFTGKGREEVAVKAWNLGADHYVNKNGDPETVYCELAHCLRSALEKHAAETQARETTKKLQTIYENALEGIAYVDPEENFVYVNKAFADILGCQEDRIVGMNLRRFVDEKDWAKIKRETERRQQGEASRYELLFRRTDGTVRNVMISGSPSFSSDGNFVGTVGIVLDITERKKAEEHLLESEEKYRNLVENSQDAIAIVDFKGNILFANKAAERLTGYTFEEGKGLNIRVITPKRLWPKSVAMLLKARMSKPIPYFEYELKRKNGTTIPVETGGQAILRGGKPVGIQIITREITERKKAEEKVRESEEKYRDLAESIDDVFFAMDQDVRCTYWNKASERLTGISEKEAVGKPITEIFPDVKGTAIEQFYLERLSTREAGTLLNKYNIKGKDFTFEINAYPTQNGFSIIAKDITERMKAEELVRASEERYRSYIEVTGQLGWTTNASGEVEEDIPAWRRYTGQSYEEAKRWGWTKALHPDDLEHTVQAWKKAVAEKSPYEVEYRIRRYDGIYRYFLARGVPSFEKDGTIREWVGTCIDITERKKAEEKYRNLFELAPDVLITLDMKGVITSCNASALAMSGYSRDEIVGKHISEMGFLRIRDMPKYLAMFTSIARGKVPEPMQVEWHSKDGTPYVSEFHVGLIKEDDKNVGLQLIARDITERKVVEENLSESEERFRGLFESIQDPVGIFVGREGHLIDYNAAFRKLSGYTDEELKDKTFLDFVHPDDHDLVLKKYRTKYSEEELPLIYEIRALNKKGKAIPLELSVSTYKKKGRIIGIEVIHRDITERKKAEDALKRSERKYREFADSLPEIAFEVDERGNVTFFNRRASEILGYSQKDFRSMSIFQFLIPEDRVRVKENIQRILKGEESSGNEYTLLRKDGSTFPVLALSDRVISEDGKVGVRGVIINITEQKRAEKERRRYEEKLSALNTYSRNLNMATSMEAIYDMTLEAAEKALGFEFADILIVEGKMLCLATHRGRSRVSSLKLPLAGDKGITVKAAKTGKPVFVPDVSKEKAYVEGGLETRSELAAPIMIGDKVLGVLNVESKEFNAFDEKDQALLEILASHAATAISNLEYAKNLEVSAREIRESQQRFERLFMDNPEAAVYMDSDFHILDINPRFSELFGYSLDEVKGKHINDVVVPKAKMEEAKMLERKFMKGPVYHDNTVRKRKDGNLVPVSISGAPIIVENQLVGSVGLYKDISQLKKAEEELRQNQEKFERLFMDNPEAAVYMDSDFHILDINPRFSELFGYSLDEVKGKHINDVVVQKGGMEEAEMLDKKAIKGYVYHDTVRRRKDGSLVPVSVSAAPITIEGRLLGYVGMYKDISELKKIEKKLETMNEKLRVVGSLTRHDVRNKFSTITGNIYLNKKKLADHPEILASFKDMELACEQIVRIFDFAKDYEMLGAEELKYVDVENVVNEAVSLFPNRHGVKITNSCHGLTVLADSLLRQLFYNLIDNSLKYGEKLSHITIRYEKAEGNQLRLVYEDDGVGIAWDAKPKIFGEGYTAGKGSGYGLYLVKRTMDAYGWDIRETGTPGKGACFTILVPETNEDGKENYQLSDRQV